MAGKRTATSDLNHTNWNQDDKREEAGSFSKASDEVLKNRVVKIAKRRNPIGSLAASEGDKKGAFANFGGFTKAPLSTPSSSSSSSSPFGFLSSLTKSEEQPKRNGLNDASGMKTSSSSAGTSIFQLPEKSGVSTFGSAPHNSKKSKVYYAKLKGLNESVSNWIKKHVDANPFLNLTPVFRDYEKYLDEIESSNKEEESDRPSQFTHKITEVKTVTSSTKTETQKEISTLTFKPSEGDTFGNERKVTFTSTSTKLLETEKVPEEDNIPKFGLGSRPTGSSTPNAPTFSFGKVNAQPSTSAAGFTFGGDATKPFTFSNVAKPLDTESTKENNEVDDDDPPKVEFTPVIEEGHIYKIRCKVFVKKDDKFGDRGVGNLFLKPVPDSSKIQLIVRADTSLGNLLCNFILSSSIPMKRMGKKDVMLICIPTPDSKPSPVPILLRVKSPEEADELLQTLEKHKK